MESGLKIFTLITVMQFIIGNLSNGFIVLINFIDWVSERKLSSVDPILVMLAISRIGLVWHVLISWFPFMDHLSSAAYVQLISVSLWVLFNHFSLWLATILSIFYLLKIASFSRPIFLYLKWRVKNVILMMMLAALVFLFLNLIVINTHVEDWNHRFERITTWNSTVSDSAALSQLIMLEMIMFSLIPFVLALISFLLLIFSLWKHLQKMKLNSKGLRDPRTKAHTNALKIIISFLLLYTTYFLCLLVSWISHIHQIKMVQVLSGTIGLLYPSSHSLILILGNSKLRQASLLVLRQLKCGTKDEKFITL
ncbi:taste receptor type 2 member 13-like [Fukomys damarensis]|uniref:taste receptor type 2 member 13-like n=1 Tax=Fukomys damarensis TaxID=885580 RepID=UPI00053F5B4D|nr:taste receptor type 2 member 13-like [Fukomys damarensis]